MKKSSLDHNGETNKVVPLRLDASFYFERAIRSIECRHYDKALKYFRFGIEKEPDNPINHCNLAGLLSELGKYQEANDVLEKVLSEIDPEHYVCFYFMANNYAYLEKYELAEQCLLEYLDHDPDGEYVEEAEEMLYLLAYELGRPPRSLSSSLPEYMKKHEKARVLLEEGQFLHASKMLEEIIEEAPSFLAAYNNLSLAYFYMGRVEEAIDLAEHVLKQEPANLHALCNLAILTEKSQKKQLSQQLVDSLKKLIPIHQDHLYKLATTLGMVGEHEAAYHLFRQLVKQEIHDDPNLHHCVAVAACNTGRLSQARRFWKRAASLDPDSLVPRFYLDQVEDWLEKSKAPIIQYHYQLPYEEKLFELRFQQQSVDLFRLFKPNPLLRSCLNWVMDQDQEAPKLKVIQLLGVIGDRESELMLRQYLLKRTCSEESKKLALLVLRKIEAAPPYLLWLNNRLMTIQPPSQEKALSSKLQMWSQILVRCLEEMKDYTYQQQDDLKVLWFAFIRTRGEELPHVRRVNGWVAAFEYVIAKHHGLQLTQSQLANKYEVSVSTVSHHVKQLNPLKGVFSK